MIRMTYYIWHNRYFNINMYILTIILINYIFKILFTIIILVIIVFLLGVLFRKKIISLKCGVSPTFNAFNFFSIFVFDVKLIVLFPLLLILFQEYFRYKL